MSVPGGSVDDMPLARYKDLCIDAVDAHLSGRYYAAALGLRFEADEEDAVLRGPRPEHTVWVNQVPESKTAKNRVHVDVHAAAVADLVAAGATVVNDRDFRWVVMTDPEGQELCAFVRERPPAQRLYGVVVDCADAEPIARWWGGVLGVEPGAEEDEAWSLENLPGVPFDGFVFGPVPEPKTVKNRVHWDVVGDTDALLAAGARMLLPRGKNRDWDVLADPEGNEFCTFPR